jgi:hypothetical protein
MARFRRPSHGTVVAYVALFFAMGGTAVAATGGNFILGHSNYANATTTLTRTTAGAPLYLRAQSGSAPLAVNSTKQVGHLNSTYVDGRTAGQLTGVAAAVKNAGAQSFNTVAWHDISGMATTIIIPANSPRRVVFTYSAECNMTGGNAGDWGSVQILVDGAAVTANPINSTDQAFCTQVGTQNAYVSASTQGVAILAPGLHNIKVQANPVFTGDSLRLDDEFLTAIAA